MRVLFEQHTIHSIVHYKELGQPATPCPICIQACLPDTTETNANLSERSLKSIYREYFTACLGDGCFRFPPFTCKANRGAYRTFESKVKENYMQTLRSV